jgi:hypothetical protein
MNKLLTESNSDYLTFRKEPFILVILGLIMLNLFNVHIYYCYLFIPIVVLIFKRDIHLMSYSFISICTFSILYFVFLLINQVTLESWTLILGYCIFPPIFYFIGKYTIGT